MTSNAIRCRRIGFRLSSLRCADCCPARCRRRVSIARRRRSTRRCPECARSFDRHDPRCCQNPPCRHPRLLRQRYRSATAPATGLDTAGPRSWRRPDRREIAGAHCAKYRQIIGEETDVNAVSAALDARRTALRDGRYTARRNLEGATSPTRPWWPAGYFAAHCHIAAKVVDDIDAEIAALDERQRALNQKRSRLPANLRVYLGSIVGPIAEHASPAETRRRQARPGKDRVEIVRERLAVLAADLHAVESSPLPKAASRKQHRFVDKLQLWPSAAGRAFWRRSKLAPLSGFRQCRCNFKSAVPVDPASRWVRSTTP